MREALEEFLVVLAYSTKTQLAVMCGLAFFMGTMIAGDYFTTRMEIHGTLSPLTEMIREKIAHRYDKVAWGVLFSFLLLAAKFYKKDRKRLLDI